jgi:hypothetical protein
MLDISLVARLDHLKRKAEEIELQRLKAVGDGKR